MREIKFRAWIKNEKRMDWVSIMQFIGLGRKTVILNNKGIAGGDYSFADIVLMQFTGLKDKGGKEIYEGDILDNSSQTIKVCWDSIGGKWFGHYVDKKRTSSFWVGEEFKKYKVIGNIFENSKLLKGV